ncbi:hypothetical protein E2C01_061508 [Portunus trituberculatus]|uniref:Nucleic-acid-binding protein from transposon X-element n=1 Tax=Portunus trituberculatus TaxID=210409 RepID=A0A5B7HF79_PORTR|nr:hypothetical protein [Portunus trituberculatus]
MKEGRHRPYLTVNPRSAAYYMLVREGLLGLTMTPADPDARQQMVIVHGVSTTIIVDLLSTPVTFFWLKMRVVAGEPCPQLLSLVEGAVPSSVHLHRLGRFRVGLYIPEPDLCGHCCRFGHQNWKCKSAPRCRYFSGGRPSSTCLKIRAGTRVVPLCCNCGSDHNASSRRCHAQSRPVRETQTPGTTVCPSRVVFRPAPALQHNPWANGTPSWTAPYYAAVVGAEGAAPALQAGVPATLQDVVQLLLEIRADLRDLCVKVTALERQRDAASPPPQSVPAPVQPAPQPAHKNQSQSVPATPRSQLVSATVQPARDNKPQSAPTSPWPQPVFVLVHPSPQSAPDTQPQGVAPSSQPWRVQTPAPVQPPLPPVPAQPLSVPDRTPPRSGSPSVEADLVLDCNNMDTDEEEREPRAPWTMDQLGAKIAAVTKGFAWGHQQVSLSQVGGARE